MASRKTVCAICAVSFQIGRIRHSDEPRSATISSGRYNEPTGELDEEGISFAPETIEFECPAEAGCGVVMRRLVDEGGILKQDGDGVLRYDFPTYEGVGPAKMLKQGYRRAKETALRWIQFDVHRDEVGRRSDGYVDHSQDEDGEYQPSMSSGSEDPLEYDSEVIDSDPEPEDDLEEEANEETSRITDFLTRTFQMANYPEHQDFADDYGDLYHDSDSFHGLLPWHCRPESRKQPEDFVFSRDSLAGMGFGSQEDIIDWATDFEHIAGPGCQRRDGYNGNIISMDEMRGCRTYQYLFHKPSAARDLGGHWKSQEVDAEPFEIESDWALSGVAESNSMLGLGYTDSDVFPERHGVRHRPYPHFESHDLDYAPCFHPWCWEIFCRVLKRQHGDLRVDGFVSWFETASSNRAAEFPGNQDVWHCTQQHPDSFSDFEVWEHMPGTEYLISNPLYAPSIRQVLESCISDDPEFDMRNDAFGVASQVAPPSVDTFVQLPREVRLTILEQLHSRDIASLRLASRSFRQLPNALFRHLVRKEIPWLWEAQPDSPLQYSCWTAVTPEDVKALQTDHRLEMQSAQAWSYIMREEYPEMDDQIREEVERWRRNANEEFRRRKDIDVPNRLTSGKTDWYRLYSTITREWKSLRGLRNRERIWKCCEEILRQIKTSAQQVDGS